MSFNAIAPLSGQQSYVFVPKVYIRALGNSFPRAALLNQIVHWSDRAPDRPGFNKGEFYKSMDEWYDEICCTPYQVRSATKHLAELSLVSTRKRKVKGTPYVHYTLDRRAYSLWYKANIEKLVLDCKETSQSTTQKRVVGSKETSQSEDQVSLHSDYEETAHSSYTKTTTKTTNKDKDQLASWLAGEYPDLLVAFNDLGIQPPKRYKLAALSHVVEGGTEYVRAMVDSAENIGLAIWRMEQGHQPPKPKQSLNGHIPNDLDDIIER